MGMVLARHKIDCFASYYYHGDSDKSHEARFSIYADLLTICLSSALEFYENLEVRIAQQGGWVKYRSRLVNKLETVVDEASSRRGFRRARFEFQSAAKPGIQIADYYAGATRDYLQKLLDKTTAAPFELIEHQIRELEMPST